MAACSQHEALGSFSYPSALGGFFVGILAYSYNIGVSMDVSRKVLSDVILHMKYARYLPEEKRRETWEEVVTRNMNMHIVKFPQLEQEIRDNYKYVYERKVLPSMRTMQFAGRPIELNCSRGYNCAYLPIDTVEAFSETMFLLLGGTGVGYSVQTHHIEKLPPLRGPIRAEEDGGKGRRYLINDSLEGWAETIKILMESYFFAKKDIDFDYRDIRPMGAQLLTAGGKAPGPQPLKDCVHNIRKILDSALQSRGRNCHLTSLEVHDIMCYIADAVLSGGIRRSAMISFFSFDDEEMLNCKNGRYWESAPQRGRANNSVVLLRHKLTKADFSKIWKRVEASGTGEPGVFLTNDKNMLGNPCNEASLHENTFCNLVTMLVSDIDTQEEFEVRCKVATFISTLQASYTEFHYLREVWRKNTERDALLGISMTGIATKEFLDTVNLSKGAEVVLAENERVAKIIKINKAARTCLTKPDGTSSLLLGCSSGIHAWYDKFYIRRIRVGKNEPIYTYFKINNPDALEEDKMSNGGAIIVLPIKAPDGAITRNESALDTLERVRKVYNEWIVPGHRKGSNTHNSSVTVNIKPDEWDTVEEWMWENRDHYNGISVLPYDNGVYEQAPFESITEEQYNEMILKVQDIDLRGVLEDQDGTNLSGEIACGGGACELR